MLVGARLELHIVRCVRELCWLKSAAVVFESHLDGLQSVELLDNFERYLDGQII